MCVTGATGFLGSWLVKRLLEKDYTVHATVRDPDNKAKVSHLLSLPGAEERLKLFRADLLESGSFDDAVANCDGVFHVASPVETTQDVMKPAIEGTLNVLKACSKSKTVKRVVVTSSVSAVCINSEQLQQDMDESCWSDVTFLQNRKPPTSAYELSKTLAERAAWDYVNEHGLDMVTIIPALVAGPCITPMVPISIELALSPLTGNKGLFQGLKHMQMILGSVSMVHVEDVCNAHIFVMENASARGRYICGPINISVPQLVEYLVQRYPRYNVLT
ncbi:hypothetical protein KI387_017999, partial [Taxus chinensis]